MEGMAGESRPTARSRHAPARLLDEASTGTMQAVSFLRRPLAISAAAALILASCASKGTVILALDEAFSAARPGLARELNGGPGRAYRLRTFPIKLSDAPGDVLAKLEEAKKNGEKPITLIASPLLAAALPGPWRGTGAEESCLGDTNLLIPEFRGILPAEHQSPGSFFYARSDPLPAYATAGAACGEYIVSLKTSEGSTPACAILFRESAARPRVALEAFTDAYAKASDGSAPIVRELTSDEDQEAEAAVRELLGADIRLLFVALGGAGNAAIRAAAGPDAIIGADFPGLKPPAALTFRVKPDDRGHRGGPLGRVARWKAGSRGLGAPLHGTRHRRTPPCCERGRRRSPREERFRGYSSQGYRSLDEAMKKT